MTNEAAGKALAIRDAQSTDHTALARLLHELGYESTPGQVRARLEALASSPADRVLVAELQGEVVGCISLHALPLFHTAGHLGRITSMVVDERYRSEGIGAALIAAAERWFVSAGCVKLEVTSSDRRLDAHRFYERHGLSRDGQRLARSIRL
ncbi:GNAT family N-acetyltransferase [Pseudoduganella lutea]|uniref:GNAT family N-acetyltransferase n=1 Tax=Pseudoduganella lutea TaxID=321985 RepID=A0A4P6KXD9_9BURK|nr:GNAT family N-acetyltransferase [Pseudoduganella lutea]QBE62928.1 GNAT family N-acetyltransferase [Pseudoduganella lutea]